MNKKDNLSKKLGIYLKHLRKESGLKLDEVSEKSELSVSYVSRLENGLINAPSLYTIEAMAEVYDLSVFELLKVSVTDNKNPMSLEELIIRNDFSYKGKEVDLNTKRAIINLISSLLDFKMDNHIEQVVNTCYLLKQYSEEIKCKEGV